MGYSVFKLKRSVRFEGFAFDNCRRGTMGS